jgi:hypothetical protein
MQVQMRQQSSLRQRFAASARRSNRAGGGSEYDQLGSSPEPGAVVSTCKLALCGDTSHQLWFDDAA